MNILFISIFERAIFAEAGNIWLKNKNPFRPAVEFIKDFLKQLAVDAGIGIRFDMQILLLRFDVAFPLRKPWVVPPPTTLQQINFNNRAWRKENIVFNLAIGYPF